MAIGENTHEDLFDVLSERRRIDSDRARVTRAIEGYAAAIRLAQEERAGLDSKILALDAVATAAMSGHPGAIFRMGALEVYALVDGRVTRIEELHAANIPLTPASDADLLESASASELPGCEVDPEPTTCDCGYRSVNPDVPIPLAP